jgi:fatty acid desaturase
MRKDSLLEELVSAIAALAALTALLSAVYWLFTGLSPWPSIVVTQVLAFGSGLGVMTLTSPRRRRP